jgi:hypothetical protein
MYKEMVEVNKFVTLATESPENMVTWNNSLSNCVRDNKNIRNKNIKVFKYL